MNLSVDEFLAKALAGPVDLTIRDLLGVWGYRARTYENVAQIQHDLSAAGLRCQPGLGEGDSDSAVRVGATDASSESGGTETGAAAADSEEPDEPLVLPPAALLIRHIRSAARELFSVHPDESLAKALALMSANDVSQLPVLAGPRDLKGAVSWRSIAQAGLGKAQITLADATTSATVVSINDELLKKIDAIAADDFVFVRDEGDRICGIVTSADLTDQFRDLTTPFFELGEIETRLRRCIDGVFSPDELRTVTRDKRIRSADNMTFKQYAQVLDDEDRWQRMGWGWAHCKTFIDYLEAARVVRNRVMHFGEKLSLEDKVTLERCLNFLKVLDRRL
jgi:CBS domain-containing protein